MASVLLPVALCVVSLPACELAVATGLGSLVYAWSKAVAVRKYDIPYERFKPVAVKSTSVLHLQNRDVDEGKRKTTVSGKDVDGHRVSIRIYALEEGKKSEVRVRVGAMGEEVPTKVYFDTINDAFGLPPETDPYDRKGD
jgi:hypothetical protein